MPSVNLSGSTSLAEAMKRASAAGVSAGAASQWWDLYGKSAMDKQQSLVSGFEQRESAAIEANKARETEIRNMYAGLINQDQGAARAAGLSEIERGERQSLGQGMQQMISSGLFGTTTAAALPTQVRRVGTEQRLKLEDMLTQRTNEAKLGLAGFVERIEQPYPDYQTLLAAMSAANS